MTDTATDITRRKALPGQQVLDIFLSAEALVAKTCPKLSDAEQLKVVEKLVNVMIKCLQKPPGAKPK